MGNAWDARRATSLHALPGGTFTRPQALAVGVSVRQLGTLVESGLVDRVAHGIYRKVDGGDLDLAAWVRARTEAIRPRAVVAHESAAVLWQLRTPFQSDPAAPVLHILRDRLEIGPHTQTDLRILPALFEASHATQLAGVRVTTLARTALDTARGCSFERALVPIDHALMLGASRDELVGLAVYMNGWPGTRVFRPALLWGDARSESALESMARGRALACGLPPSTPQHALVGRSGALYRGDLVWPEPRVVLELDGREKYDGGRAALLDEKAREDDIRAADWRVVRMTYDEIFDTNRTRWLQLAECLGVPLAPYNAEFGMKPRWEQPRRRTRAIS